MLNAKLKSARDADKPYGSPCQVSAKHVVFTTIHRKIK